MLAQKKRKLDNIVRAVIQRDADIRLTAIYRVYRAVDDLKVHTLGIDFYTADGSPLRFYMGVSAKFIDRIAIDVVSLTAVGCASAARGKRNASVFLPCRAVDTQNIADTRSVFYKLFIGGLIRLKGNYIRIILIIGYEFERGIAVIGADIDMALTVRIKIRRRNKTVVCIEIGYISADIIF